MHHYSNICSEVVTITVSTYHSHVVKVQGCEHHSTGQWCMPPPPQLVMFTTQCTVWNCSHVVSFWCCDTDVSVAGEGVRFSLNGTTYPNNSLVTLEDISEDGDALLCVTDLTACCRYPYTAHGYWGYSIGNWFFPNRTRVPSPGEPWELYRSRGQMVVLLNRRQGGEDGIYCCEIPDSMNVYQTIYIGVYTANTGEW